MENIIGVRDLKAQLSKYLRLVQSGTTITITDHGKPVGRLVPVKQNLEEKLLDSVLQGQASWNGEKIADREPVGYNTSTKTIAEILEEDRGG
jgi:prevent-host-death family protein